MTGRLTLSWSLRSVAVIVAIIMAVAAAYATAVWLVDAKGQALMASLERDAVSDELDLFSVVYRDEGRTGLLREMAQQVELNSAHKVYGVRDGTGAILAGNLKAWPETVPDSADWVSLEDPGGRGELHLSAHRLPDGLTVLVGHDNDVLQTFQATIVGSLWLAVTIVAVTCLLMAVLVTAFVMIRVRELSDTAARVSAGDFSARATASLGKDPFGQIAQAQNTMLDRIEDLVTGLRTVTDSLAHDLRTPLARTRRCIEQGVLSDNPEAKQAALEDALSETDRTIATFTGLIDIARAEGGLSRDSMAQVDLAALLVDVYDLFEPLAEEHGVRFTVLSEDITINGHKAILMQAVSNLVHNALKYAPDGGEVELQIAGLRDGEAVQIVVRDNGPGISAEDRADAVRRFSQVGAQPRPEGLGLGLAIVEACARLHRGALLLEDNQPGLCARLVLSMV